MRTAFVLLALAALTLPAAADEPCYTTSNPELTLDLGDNGTWYVDNDLCQAVVGDGSCLFSVWVYEEVNGIPGLQRQDEVRNDVANCQDGTTGDVGGMW